MTEIKTNPEFGEAYSLYQELSSPEIWYTNEEILLAARLGNLEHQRKVLFDSQFYQGQSGAGSTVDQYSAQLAEINQKEGQLYQYLLSLQASDSVDYCNTFDHVRQIVSSLRYAGSLSLTASLETIALRQSGLKPSEVVKNRTCL